jgi:hypothetical protein
MTNPAPTGALTRPTVRGASPWRQARLEQLVDEMLEHYVDWREECAAVAWSYQSWGGAERRDKALAFSAYVAALDREELAAANYRRLIEQIASV